MIQIVGRRVILRDFQLGDIEPYSYWLQPEQLWHTLDGPYYAKSTPEQIAGGMKKLRKDIESNDWPSPRRRLAMIHQEDKKFLGTVSWYWVSEETNWLAVGIAICDPDYWKRGLGYEALGLWSEYLLQAMPELVRLDLRTWSGNTGMMRLAEKLGYKQEACFRKARIVNGEYYDSIGYGVLREEWEANYPGGFKKSHESGTYRN